MTRTRAVPRFVQNTIGDSVAVQSAKAECDINNIMRKFEKTRMIDHVRSVDGSYIDVTGFPQSYQESLNQVLEAQRMFDTVPAKVRKRFGNDPGQFLEFVENPENIEECRKLGLAVPAPEPVSPVQVEVVNPPKADDGNSST